MDGERQDRDRLQRDIGAIRTSLDNQGEAIAQLRAAVERQHELIERIVRLEERQNGYLTMVTGIHARIDVVVAECKEFRGFEALVRDAMPNMKLASTWVFRAALSICGLMTMTAAAIVAGQITGAL